MSDTFITIAERVSFDPARYGKADLARGAHLFAGVNCFHPGQTQAVHRHAGADKFYFLVTGKARMVVGDEERIAVAGDLVWAPADLPHGVIEALEETVMLVAMSPPPHK